MKPELKSLENDNAHLGLRPVTCLSQHPHKLFSELLQPWRSGGFLYFTRTLKIGKGKAKMHAVPFSLALTCAGVGKSRHSSCRCLCRSVGTFAGLLQQKGMSPAARSSQSNAECGRIAPASRLLHAALPWRCLPDLMGRRLTEMSSSPVTPSVRCQIFWFDPAKLLRS